MARMVVKKKSPAGIIVFLVGILIAAGVLAFLFVGSSGTGQGLPGGIPPVTQTAQPPDETGAPTPEPAATAAPFEPPEPQLAVPPPPPALPADLPPPQTVTLKCTADNSIIPYPAECVYNHGAKSSIRVKGIDHLAALNFDFSPVKGMVAESAVLKLTVDGNDLDWLDVSSISTEWVEGRSESYEVDTKGNGSCFLFASWTPQPQNARPWGYRFPLDTFTPEMMNDPKEAWKNTLPRDDFTDASFYPGRCIFKDFIKVRKTGDNSREIDIPPQIIELNAAGLAFGIAVHDGAGETGWNNSIRSRETNEGPSLVVTGRRYDTAPPAAPSVSAVSPAPGKVRFTVLNPGDESGTLAYVLTRTRDGLRETLPRCRVNALPGPYKHKTTMFLYDEKPGPAAYELAVVDRAGNIGHAASVDVDVMKDPPFDLLDRASRPAAFSAAPKQGALVLWAVPDTAQVDPVSGASFERSDDRRGNTVWDPASSTVHLKSARNEVVAFQLVLEPASGAASSISVRPGDLSGPAVIPASNIDLFRTWYVKCDDGKYHPDPCVPLDGALDIPWTANAVPGQKNQSVWVDIAVPKNAAPGTYSGALTVSSGTDSFPVSIELDVWPFALPDFPSYVLELNAYSGIGKGLPVRRDSPEYARLELAYHQLGHKHRQTLNVLPYSQSGNLGADDYVPQLSGAGASVKVSSWDAWDRRFGGYFDGSAFTPANGYSGIWTGTPVTHFYLPFHENWPLPIEQHYKVAVGTTDYPALIIEHMQKAPPIDQAFSDDYKEAFSSMARQYAEHIRDKGWDKTRFQFYLNNKHSYKKPDAKTGRPGRGTSWWLLDEPRNMRDFLALKWYGELFWRGAGDDARSFIDYRIDLSRPQWQHDTLDGIATLACISSAFYPKYYVTLERRDRLGETFWHYGGGSAVGADNLNLRALVLKDWSMGADGTLPYYTSFEGDKGWDSPERLAVVLVGARVGINGPLPSMRMKVLRRAQQDVEYLNLAAARFGRDRVTGSLAKMINLTAEVDSRHADDPGRAAFRGLDEAVFESARSGLADLLK
ncbi:MAG: hypothetical protein JW909_04755 [Planctomycetes bacterium]|nr:hypothetical protein [Planctomycetota bacterium]